MKKISIKLLLLISILFIALGCEKDDAIGEGENSSEIQEVLSKTLNLEDIPNYDKVNKSIQKLDKNLNSGANSLFKNLDTDEVQILTDDIIYMTYAETHTYTFKLLRNNPQYYIENIVLHYNVKTFSYDEYLVQYDVNDQEFIQINQGLSLGDDVDVLITELKEGTLNSFLGKSSCFRVCETVNVNCSAGGDHSYGETCNGTADQQPYQFQSCGPICIDTGSGPSTDDPRIDDGGNTGGGGSTPGDDNVLTNPNPNEPCETSNGSTGITGDDGCITTVDEIERGNLLISIGDRLSISERNWVNNQAPLDKITQINQFIDELSWRDRNEGKDFSVEVVKVLIENPEAEVVFEELYIETPTPDDVNNNFQGPVDRIPEVLTLDNGDEINITFGVTNSDETSADQEVAELLIDGIKFALQKANENLPVSHKITDIYIMATTNGRHSSTSNHARGTAIDISRINGQKMILVGSNNQIEELQIAMDAFPNVRENFGPYFKHKYSVESDTWNYSHPVGGHQDHIHFSVR